MPEYLAPGVYIEEIERGPLPIEGVPASVAAFLGETERGPVTPRMVTSYKEFQQWFGGTFATDKFMPYAVAGFFENGGRRLFVCRVATAGATPAEASFGQLLVRAIGPGAWGRRIWARIDNSSGLAPDTGYRLRLAYWSESAPSAPLFDPFAEPLRLPRPSLVEDFDNLASGAVPASALASLVPLDGMANARPSNGSCALAQGGADGAPVVTVADFEGDPSVAQPGGLAALSAQACDDVSLLYAPGATDAVARAIIAHCEANRFRFAVVDAAKGSAPTSLAPRTTLQASMHAAFYYPWIAVADPQTGAAVLVPPGGHVLGVYARTDAERGVHKAPANEALRGTVGLEFNIDNATQAMLNPRGVNLIRLFPGRGIRVWGARTLSSDSLWTYVNVRRLFSFIERSIDQGTQWLVFEPNEQRLWARVRDVVTQFLTVMWRQGALAGQKAEHAYFVRCDETTMTQDDMLTGRLIIEIGIAPVRPAEFVIFRIFQQTGLS
jgi:phage tail sheath protein FI